MYKYLRWAFLLPIAIIVGLFGRICSPIVCLFVERKSRTDTVKRLGKQVVTLERDDLVWWLSWYGTDDNDVSEYWYGMYPLTKNYTQSQYDNSKVLRWFFRVCWLQRNSAYTFNRKFFGIPKDSKLAWQYKAIKPLLFWYNDINIGYKSHKGFDTLMLAGRVIGLRKNKEK